MKLFSDEAFTWFFFTNDGACGAVLRPSVAVCHRHLSSLTYVLWLHGAS